MTDEIFFEGTRYLSAQEASSSSDLTRDYVARLCRDGKLVGKRVGKNWYVHEASFKEFLVSREYAAHQRSESLAQERRREYHAVETTVPAPASSNTGAPEQLVKAFQADTSLSARSVKIPLHEKSDRFSALHVPTYAITPTIEFFNRSVALALAFTLTFGTFAAVDPAYAQFAAQSAHDEALAVAQTFEQATQHAPAFAVNTNAALTAAAADPAQAFGNLSDSLFGNVRQIAQAWNESVNSFVYGVAFPQSSFASGTNGTVAVSVEPYPASPEATQGKPATVAATTATTVVQRIVEVEPATPAIAVATAGGITQSQLDGELQQLDNKLSSQMYSLTSANSTAIAQNYNVTAQTNAIDQLTNTTITNPTINGGSLSNVSISATGVSASSLSVSGDTYLASTTVSSATLSGDLIVNGNTTLNGTLNIPGAIEISSSTIDLFTNTYATTTFISAVTASTTNLTWVNATGTNTVLTNATSTNFFSTLADIATGVIDNLSATAAAITGLTVTNSTTTNATTTNEYVSNFAAVNASTTNASSTNLFAENASTTNATSTDLFAALSNFTTSIISNLTATLATITGLNVTNSTTTNATTTNEYVANFQALNASTTNATSTNFFATTASSSNLYAAVANLGSTIVQNLTVNGTSTLGSLSASNGYFSGGLGVGVATTSPGVLQTSGDAWIGGNLTVVGNSTVLGDSTVIGNSSTNLLTVNAQVNSDIIPDGNELYDLGSPSYFWRNAYIQTLDVDSISAASTTIGGTNSASFTINAQNSTADQDNMNLIFNRGTVVPNAVISWDSATSAKRFEFNQSLYINNASASTTEPTLTLQSTAGQTANILQIASSSGALLAAVDASGNALFGTTTITNLVVSNTSTSTFQGGISLLALNLTGNATSTAANGFNIAAGCFAVSGTCLPNNGYVAAAVAASYEFPQAGNGTSTLTQFNGGVTAFASSTIGNGMQAGGLTVSGGATTTGNAYFGGKIGIGTASPAFPLEISADGTGAYPTDDGNGQFVIESTDGSARLGFMMDTVNDVGVIQAAHYLVGNYPLMLNPNGGSVGVGYFETAALSGALDVNGNVGINTTNPQFTLEVNGTASTTNLFATNGTSTNFFASTASSTNLFSQSASIGNATSTNLFASIASSTNLFATNASFGTLNFSGLGTFASGFVSQASSTVVGNFTATGAGSFATLAATQTSGTSTIASGQGFTIGGSQFVVQQGSGNVGIGTASPSQALSINGNEYLNTNLGIGVAPSSGGSGRLFTNGVGWFNYNGTSNIGVTQISATGGSGSADVGLYDNNGNAKIDLNANGASYLNGGNVGIGTTTPNNPLTVNGGESLEGSLQSYYNSSSALAGYWGTGFALFGVGPDAATDLGIRSIGNFGLSTNNSATPSLVVNTSGNLGIGTTSPFAKLSLAGSAGGTTPLFNISSSTSAFATTTVFAIDQNGNTTIGGNGTLLTVNSNALLANATTTNLFSTTASSTNLFAQTASLGTLNLSGLATFASGFVSQASSTVVGNFTSTGTGSFANLAATAVTGTSTIATGQGFTVGGSQFVLQQGSGNVGIGTASPTASLTVNGVAGRSLLQVATSTNASILTLDQNGNLALGTQSPAATFEISNPLPSFELSNGTWGALKLAINSTMATFGTYYNGGISFLINGNQAAQLSSNGHFYIGDEANSGGPQLLTVDTTNVTGGITVETGDAAGNERLRLMWSTSAGTAAIAQNALPAQIIADTNGNLQIAPRTSQASGITLYNNPGTNAYPALTIASGGTIGAGTTTPWAELSASSTSANPGLAIQQNSTGPAAIFLGGNVGIGTTSPSTTLGLVGSQYLTGGLGVGVLNTTAGTLQTSGTANIGGTATVGSLINNGVTVNTLLYANGSKQESSVSLPAYITLTSGSLAISALPVADLAADTISGVTLGNALGTLTFGAHLAAGGSSYNGSAGVTISTDATNANTASTIVARDSSGNFSAGTITANLTGTASNVTTDANLTGPITSSGNATAIASQTGTGSTFAMSASPTFTGSINFPGSGIWNSSGNVGIGTTSPNSILAVRGGVAATAVDQGTLQIGVSAGASSGGLEGGVATVTGAGNIGYLQGFNFASGGAAALAINPFGSGNTLLNVSGGNVGIGTTNPGTARVAVQNAGSSSYLLDIINQNGNGLGGLYEDGSSNGVLTLYTNGGSQNVYIPASGSSYFDGGSVAIGTTNTTDEFAVAGSSFFESSHDGLEITPGTSVQSITTDWTSGGSETPISVGTWSNRTNQLYLSTSGNVGIGTTNPLAPLQVYGGQANPSTQNFATTSNLFIGGYGGNGLAIGQNTSYAMWEQAGYDGAITAYYNLLLEPLGGNVGIGTSTPNAKLTIDNDAEAPNSPTLGTDIGSDLAIGSYDDKYGLFVGVTGNGSTWLQGQRSDGGLSTYNILLDPAGGNVGIGTTTPGSLLTVAGTIASVRNNGGNGLQYWDSESGFLGWYISSQSGQLNFNWTDNTGTYQGTYMTLNSSGQSDFRTNVGIGTTTPDYPLVLNVANNTTPNALELNHAGVEDADFGVSGGAGEFLPNSVAGDLAIRNNNGRILFGANGYNTNMVISSGNVGIGTTNPGALLQVNGTRNAPASGALNGIFRITNTADTGIAEMGISSSGAGFWIQSRDSNTGSPTNYPLLLNPLGGNVGIGMTGPSYPLDVTGNVRITGSLAMNTTPNSSNFINAVLNANAISYSDFYNTNNNSSAGVDTRLITENAAGTGTVAVDLIKYQSGLFSIDNGETGSTGAIAFAVGGTERMRINNAGNVGIGTTSPGTKLDIASAYYNGLRLDNGSNQFSIFNDGNAHIESTAGSPLWINGDVNAPVNINQGGGQTYLGIGGGNVGIGTNSPLSPLHVYSTAASGNPSGELRVESSNDPSLTVVRTGTQAYSFVVNSENNNDLQITNSNANATGTPLMDFHIGNVGIGTPSPGTPLTVQSSTQYSGIVLQNASHYVANLQGNGTGGDNGNLYLYNAGAQGVDLSASGSSFLDGGNVGIGTTNPQNLLTLNGNLSLPQGDYIGFVNNAALTTSNYNIYGDSSNLLLNAPSIIQFRIANAQEASMSNQSLYPVTNAGLNLGIGGTNEWGCLAYNNSTLGTCASDENIKKDITSYSSSLAEVTGLNPVTFRYDTQSESDTMQIGLIAQQVQQVAPSLVGTTTYNGATVLDVNYSDLPYLTINAIKQLNDVYDATNASTSQPTIQSYFAGTTTPAIWVDSAGNVGIGTSTPSTSSGQAPATLPYQLTVAGSIGAEDFVDYSMRSLKTNITALQPSDDNTILGQIASTTVFTYNYKDEPAGTPLHIGLITDSAPSAVLAAGGGGVDIYKLASFTLAGLQAEDNKVDALALRVTNLETAMAALSANAPTGQSSFSLDGVLTALQNLGTTIQQGLAQFAYVVTQDLVVGSPTQPSGITLYDKVTDQPYCFAMANGAPTTTPGVCTTIPTPSQTAAAAGSDATSTQGDSSSGGVSLGAPVLQLNGNDPATVNIGATYNDLGATITGPTADLNLGIEASVDGATSTPQADIAIDTSVAGTHTIIYSATDQNGLTATATRTVNVIDPNAATSTPSTGDASSTDATSTTP